MPFQLMNQLAEMIDKFSKLDKVQKYDLQINSILPRVEKAGEQAGALTAAGANLLDTTGNLEAGTAQELTQRHQQVTQLRVAP